MSVDVHKKESMSSLMQVAAAQSSQLSLTEKTAEYIRCSLSENSRRALKSDIAHFTGAWRGMIPANPEMIAEYLTAYSGALSVATLKRRLASISKAHQMKGYPSPAQSEIVKMTLRGVQRQHGIPQSQASPLLKEDVIALYGQIPRNVKGSRDKALILIGFCGAFRRSELVGLNIEDVEFTSQGAVIILTRSKTDQTGVGRKIGIPFGRGMICPVKSLQAWIDVLDADTGAIFRPVTKGGVISDKRLSGHAVSCIIKEHIKKIGELDPARYSGHSLRAGLATSAAMHGASSWKIRAQTGHASDSSLSRYIRDGDLFNNNAAGFLF